MPSNQDQIKHLLIKLEILVKKQDTFHKEIQALRQEIYELRNHSNTSSTEQLSTPPITDIDLLIEKEPRPAPSPTIVPPKKPRFSLPNFDIFPDVKEGFEKFIGENLVSKIGILIFIIGVAIGARYSIENDLISPLTRIILGYVAGIGLLGVGIKLKTNYTDLSAVLVSGAMAIFYLITFLAYDFYALIPQMVAFGLMVLFTAFTVFAALNYNRQVIALIGLVGAYAVPFLLSQKSGDISVLFSYMTIINIGILSIAFKKNWKWLYYVSFAISWMIYLGWYDNEYEPAQFKIAVSFLVVFFVSFYAIFLAFKLYQKEKFRYTDGLLLLLFVNAFIFFGVGFMLLEAHEKGEEFLGLYTLGNAAIHFAVSSYIYKKDLGDKNLFYLVTGLVLLFLTIAIPIQLDGNWVTLMWAGEAALLFWLGRTRGISFYEKLAYPLMLIAFGSILHDWNTGYTSYFSTKDASEYLKPLLNINFLSSVLFIAFFGFINYIHQRYRSQDVFFNSTGIKRFIPLILPAILLFALYNSFIVEIDNYWDQKIAATHITLEEEDGTQKMVNWNHDLWKFKNIWRVNFTLFFLIILSLFNLNIWRNKPLDRVNIGLNIAGIILFLTQGIYTLRTLRASYLNPDNTGYYLPTNSNIGIRYISFILLGTLLYLTYEYVRRAYTKRDISKAFDLFLHTTIVLVASSELINWMELAHSTQSDKLGLSILWGIYALGLVGLGLWKQEQHLRIAGMVLFGITLIKLFFYDIAHLDTIAKTVVLMSLGILLLLISFLYKKYRERV